MHEVFEVRSIPECHILQPEMSQFKAVWWLRAYFTFNTADIKNKTSRRILNACQRISSNLYECNACRRVCNIEQRKNYWQNIGEMGFHRLLSRANQLPKTGTDGKNLPLALNYKIEVKEEPPNQALEAFFESLSICLVWRCPDEIQFFFCMPK